MRFRMNPPKYLALKAESPQRLIVDKSVSYNPPTLLSRLSVTVIYLLIPANIF